MNVRSLRPATALVALGVALLSTPVATAAPSDPSRPRAALPTLTSVQAQHVGKVDRVTFGFVNGAPTNIHLEWVDTLRHDGSGLPVRVAGAKVLMVVFNNALAHDSGGATVRNRTAFALPNVITAVGAGDFEGSVSFGLGVQKRTSYTVTTLHGPDRVVVDVAAGFRTTTRKVWFGDRNADVVAVNRPVPAAAPAAGALRSLFAGPLRSERADGLRLVRSGAWGFDRLSVVDGVARLRLTRGCRSGGSTTTIASEIMPTLRQFPTVDWVKIYGPGGRTEDPTGPSDSIPLCLEP
ncbi:AMIN-like domain-containing (lipo)protein [Nocardioides halotolerans]|jgi:hypothetical protein|uniref:AMIN-like domain-containing (lipo)protein n=1 Tax=Nocardioides halotolerans TaxID=433660 RepID=UPI0004201108|nr:hypothetical protein [Nocardioides halotolerans]